MATWLVAMTAGVVLGMGCGGARLPTIDARGYHHAELEYRVDRGADGSLVTAEWDLDNLVVRADGAVAARKSGPDYRGRRRVDVDGDGDVDRAIDVDIDDLRFLHLSDGGVIWVRTLYLPRSSARTELRVLMRQYVEGIAGAGLTVSDVGGGSVTVESRRFATREVSAGPVVVAGREAFASTIDVAQVEQLELSPEAVWRRARVVFVRTDLVGSVDGTFYPDSVAPVLMMVGYSNLPEDFDRHLPDLESLLSRVVFDTPESERVAAEVLRCARDSESVGVLVDRYGIATTLTGYDECVQRAMSGAEHRRGYGFRRPDAIRVPSAAGPDAPSSEPLAPPVADAVVNEPPPTVAAGE